MTGKAKKDTDTNDSAGRNNGNDLIARMADLLTEFGQLTVQAYNEEAQAKGPLQAFSAVATIGETSAQNWGKGDTLEEALENMLQGFGK